MGEAPVPLVVARYFAIIGLLLAVAIPLPFAQQKSLTVAEPTAQERTYGSHVIALEHRKITFNETRKRAPRQLAWPIVGMLAFAAAFAEGYAYRRATLGKRRAGAAASLARAVPVVGAGGFALIACWYSWGSKELEPSFGLLVAVLATVVIIGTFVRELLACQAGERGWFEYPPPTELPFADVRRQ